MEYNEMQELEKKPQKPKNKRKNIVWIFDILGTVVALIAAVISLVTLFEMKIQRNYAYMPTIVFETVEVTADLKNSDKAALYEGVKLPARNIGVGVAKRISFKVETSNFVRWLDVYNDLYPENAYQYEVDDGVATILRNGETLGFSTDYETDKVFLLPNAEEAYEFVLPAQYKVLLYEIYKNANTGMIDIPELEIKVSYYDVQNVMYEETIHLSVKTTLFTMNGENEKLVTYQISMD